MTDVTPNVAAMFEKSERYVFIVITNMLMKLETVITSELFDEIYEDLEKGKACGTVFQVQDKSIVIELPKHDESCYATGKRILHWLMQLPVVSDSIHIIYLPLKLALQLLDVFIRLYPIYPTSHQHTGLFREFERAN